MSKDKKSNQVTESKLKPASQNIWYALATIEGEPSDLADEDVIDKNRDYWNGYMKYLTEPEERERLETKCNNSVDWPEDLKEEDIQYIHKRLQDKGFDVADLASLDSIDFTEIEFPEIFFIEFVFAKAVSFDDSVFTGDAYFQDAVFLEIVSFEDVTFKESAAFEFVVFSDDAWFNRSKFTSLAAFDATTYFGEVRFQNVQFVGRLDFGSLLAENDQKVRTRFLKTPPEFYNAKLSEDMSWSEVEFPNAKGLTPVEADFHKDAYERLALMMDRLKKHDDRYRFYRLEMRARRQMEEKWSLPRFVNWCYELLSDYGYGVGRTATLWFGNILIGALFLCWDSSTKLPAEVVPAILKICKLALNAITTSFSNAHGFLGLGRGPLKETISAYQNADLLISYNVIATAQTIMGAVFLFFFLLSLRNRFRMG